MGSEIKKILQKIRLRSKNMKSEIEVKKELYMIIRIWHAYVPFLTQGGCGSH